MEFKAGWRLGEPAYEAATIEDVKAGEVDMAGVGARAFDTVGVKSFQALVAPLQIDSYDLRRRSSRRGSPGRCWNVSRPGSRRDRCGPGPDAKGPRRVQAVRPPEGFAGQVVGLQDSVVAKKTLRALGATPSAGARRGPSGRPRRVRAAAVLDLGKPLRQQRGVRDGKPEPVAPSPGHSHGEGVLRVAHAPAASSPEGGCRRGDSRVARGGARTTRRRHPYFVGGA